MTGSSHPDPNLALGFSALLAAHGVLDDALLLHEEALLLLDVELAAELLAVHRRLLAVHMSQEESVVLPIFRRAGPLKKWPAVLYTGQHEKLKGHLDRIEASVAALRGLSGQALRRATLTVLDLETTYKHLQEHHDGAEREGLFPVTDGVATAQERSEVATSLVRAWHTAVTQETEFLRATRSRLDERATRL